MYILVHGHRHNNLLLQDKRQYCGYISPMRIYRTPLEIIDVGTILRRIFYASVYFTRT